MAGSRDLRIVGTEQLTELSIKLRAAGDPGTGLRRELRTAIRKAAKPAMEDTKRVITDLPVRGVRGGGKSARRAHQVARSKKGVARHDAGLRATIARAIALRTNLGKQAAVKIYVRQSGLPEDQRTLPRKLDSPKGWRHPVFGDREVWVSQYGKPWWASTLSKHGNDVRREILQAMGTIADRIGR